MDVLRCTEIVTLKRLSAYKSPRESDLTRAATNPQTSHNSEVVTGDTQNSAEASSISIHLKPGTNIPQIHIELRMRPRGPCPLDLTQICHATYLGIIICNFKNHISIKEAIENVCQKNGAGGGSAVVSCNGIAVNCDSVEYVM